jgi:trehalose 6-phosphate phosphatase
MKLYLFLDFDGTLAPIADTPRKAALARGVKATLRRLAALSCCTVAVISGRRLSDVRAKVGLKGIIYAGSHGLEIKGPGITWKAKLSGRKREDIRKIFERLRETFAAEKGVLIENKGDIVSFHYRLVPRKKAAGVRKAFRAMMRPYVKRRDVVVEPGKMVYEIKPPVSWDKGKAVDLILRRRKAGRIVPVFIGDDLTDEAAFRVLRGRGITIHVGNRRRTLARYRLNGTDGVARLLEQLLKSLQERKYTWK